MKKRTERVDVLSKVTGQAQYANDLTFPEMTYGKVVRCHYPHAKILKIDSSKAEEIPGVLTIVTSQDIPGINNQLRQKPMLSSEIVKYSGEGVALVVAETMAIAEEAARLVLVTYEELPFIKNPEEALRSPEIKVHETGNLLCSYKTSNGDLEAGFKQSDYIFERKYRTQREDHAPLEPEAVVAVPTPNGITVYVPTNSVYNVRQIIAETLGVSEHEVRLITPTIGGSFGAKNYDLAVMASRASLASLLTNRPCKIVFSREESILEGTKRHPYTISYKAGVKKDGTIMALHTQILGDGGAYTSKSFPVASRSAIEAAGPYRVGSSLAEIQLMYTNNVYSDAMRGFGSPQVDFASEVLWDEIAKELGLDPLAFRKQNHLQENDISAVGQVMTSVTLKECLAAVEKEIPWAERKAAIKEWNSQHNNHRRGLGLAIMHRGEAFGAAGQGIDTAAISLHTNWDGSITILSSMAEVGMGGHTMLVNIVHEVLGINPENIKVSLTDTDYVPNSGPTVATRGALVPGNACKQAAEQLKAAYSLLASKELGVSPTDLIFEDEKIYDPSAPEQYVSYQQMVKANHASGNNGYGHGWYTVTDLSWDSEKGNGDAYLSYVYGACIVEVEVNLGTGEISVLDISQAHDVGHAFDRDEVKGQINGGLVMGIGYGLFEDIEMKEGQIKNLNFNSYHLPTSMDIPDLKSVVLEIPGAHGPFGAKGLGEPTACLSAPAIINALADATGSYIRALPATLERVLNKTTL